MDPVRFGRGIRTLRHRRGWTQAELARRARSSQSAVSRTEHGGAHRLTVQTLDRIAVALDARVSVRLLWQGEALDRLLDAAHARLVDQMLAGLDAYGWEVVPEATFNHFGERGSIDVLGWHPRTGSLLVVEVKSVVPDIQAMLSGVDRKARVAPLVAADLGWRARTVSRVIVLPDQRTSRRRITTHSATFDIACPSRTRDVRRWLRNPGDELAGIMFLPSTQRTGGRPADQGIRGPARDRNARIR
jgi:transcriptional regulator with XRE-family HTH domain